MSAQHEELDLLDDGFRPPGVIVRAIALYGRRTFAYSPIVGDQRDLKLQRCRRHPAIRLMLFLA
jgi:hypothetical protein